MYIKMYLSQLYFVSHLFELQAYEFPGYLYLTHLLCENNIIFQKLVFLKLLCPLGIILLCSFKGSTVADEA